VIACQVWHDITDVMDPDADLMAAIEALRQHQLAQIDAQLAEFGAGAELYFMPILADEG
jgi:hypothetical protein